MMSFRFTVGVRIHFEGRDYEVMRLRAGSVGLRDLETAELVEIKLSEVFCAADFALLGETSDRELPVATELDLVPEHALEEARDRAAELLEADTGYRSGDPSNAEEDEPRPEYDPKLVPSRDQRFRSKAAELSKLRHGPKASLRKLWDWRARYKEKGVLGLVDSRYLRLHDPFTGYPEYVEVLREQIDAATEGSRKTAKLIRERTNKAVRERFGDEVAVPRTSKFYELHNALTRGQPANMPSRRSAAGRGTPKPSPFKATRPGEVIQFDATRADVLVIDPVSGKIGRPEFGLAVDAYDRTVRGARITLASGDAVDAALLLHDLLVPTPAGAAWPERGLWSYAGVPREIVCEVGAANLRGAEPAAIPFGSVGTVVIDQGRVYVSQLFRSGCERLNISLQPAPPRTPHFKGIVERFFRSLNFGLLQHLPGHTGENVLARGARPETEVLLFIHELEALFFDWVASVYHQTPNEGCRMAGIQGRELSPNEMFEQGLARAGFIMALPDPQQVLGLLPAHWRVIRPERGIRVDDVFYWDDALIKWLDRDSPYPSEPNKHPIHVDPRDRSQVWFHDPEKEEWHALRRLDTEEPDLPFHEDLLHWSKQRLLAQGEDAKDPDLLSEMLDDVLRRHVDGRPLDPDERRILGRMEVDTAAARRDHAAHGVGQDSPAPADDSSSASDPDGWNEGVDPLGMLE